MIIVAALAFSILLDPVSGGPESIYETEPCYDAYVAVAEEQRKIYLDPTDGQRSDATVRAIERALLPLRSFEGVDRPGMQCVAGVVTQIEWFANMAVLQPAVSNLAETYKGYAARSLWPWPTDRYAPHPYQLLLTQGDFARGLDLETKLKENEREGNGRLESDAERGLKDAREACAASGPPGALTAAPCIASLEELARSADPVAQTLLRPVIEARRKHQREPPSGLSPEVLSAALWLDLRASFSDRVRFHQSTLRPPKDQVAFYGGDAVNRVREWALNEMVGDMDPRTWDPLDVALIAREARKMDAASPPFPYSEIGHSTYTASLCWNDYLRALFPMAIARAFELVRPTKFHLAGVNTPYLLRPSLAPSDDGYVAFDPRWQHFPLESLLYDHEWHAAHPGMPAGKTDEERNFAAQCWFETDQRAPQPKWRVMSTWGFELPPDAQRLLDQK